MSPDPAVIIALLGGTGTIIGIFMKYIGGRDKAQANRDDIFAKALAANTKAMKSVAVATEKSAREAKERNGHLAELAVENNKNNNEHNAKIAETLSDINRVNTENAASNASILETLQSSALTLQDNTEHVATALIDAADKLQHQPVHIGTQKVDHQVVKESSTKEKR